MSDLAAALLQNNKKSRMNCVVERKHAEEIVDSPSKTVALPFGVNLTTDPKKARITGERISIYCEGGNENRNEQESRNNNNNNNNREEDDDSDIDADVIEPVRPMFIPYQRMPIPFGPVMQQYPLTHMPQRMMPPMPQPQQQQQQQPQHMPQAQIIRQFSPSFQPQPQQQQQPQQFRPPMMMMPPQMMQAPRQDMPSHMQHLNMIQELPRQQPQQQQQQLPHQQTVRIHVQEVPFREIHVADDVPVQIPTQHQELPHFQYQRLPLGLALQRAGITAEDLRNIQRIAEDRITDELRHLAAEEAAESAEKNSSSAEDTDESVSANDAMNSMQSNSAEQQQQQQRQPTPVQQQQQSEQQQSRPVITQRLVLQQLPEQPRDTMSPPMPNDAQAQQMIYGRASFGRSLVQPVRIPVPMMQAQADMSSSAAAVADDDSAAVATEAERPHVVQPRSV